MVLSNLPPNWTYAKLGDVVENFKRGPFGSTIKKSFFVPEGYKVYEQKNAIYNTIETGNYFIDDEKFQELKDFEVGPGDFIVSCSGTIGKIYQLPPNAPKGVINQALLRIRLKEKLIFIKFFLEFFKSYLFQKQMLVETRGSAMLNIAGVKELKKIPFPLPPLPEQKKIVAKIEELFSELDNGVEQLKTAKQQLKIYRQAVLSWAFSGKLLQSQRSSVKGQKDLLKAAEPEVEYYGNGLPEGWKWVKVIDICKTIIGGGTPSTKVPEFWNGDIDWITSADIYGIKNIKPRKKINKKAIENSAANLLPKGNIVVVTRVGLGKLAINKNDLCFSQDSQGLMLNNNIVFNEFALWYLSNAVQVFKYKNRGTTINGVTKKQLAELEFLLPPKEEQHQIVSEIESRFSVADKLEQTIDENLKKSERLRQSILKKAFEGRLV